MKKIANEFMNDIINDYSTANIFEKVAFNVNIDPSSIVGALAGAAITSNKLKKQNELNLLNQEKTVALNGNYYSQAENIAKNLKVIFTPLSVIYTVKNGIQETTIEIIEKEEMSEDMLLRWKMKDYSYFKNLLLNKMLSDIQFAEQHFAKSVIQKQMGLNNIMTKRSSEEVNEDIGIVKLCHYVQASIDMYSKNTGIMQKLAQSISDDLCERLGVCTISLSLDRPIDKYAGVGDSLAFLGIKPSDNGRVNSMQGKYLKPGYLSNKVNVGFMPDRILFVVDNNVVTSLKAVDMNEDAFSAFQKNNKPYFIKMFNKEISKGFHEMNKVAAENFQNEDMVPLIVSDIAHCFSSSFMHPITYLKILNNTFGPEWINYEPQALIRAIEITFKLENGISEIPLNKILSIQSVNTSSFPFENPLVFEKMIRSFCNLPISWENFENDDLDIQDIIFGIDVFDMVTPDKDTYDLFNSEVMQYIAENIAKNNYKCILPDVIMNKSHNDEVFYAQLNSKLVDENSHLDLYNVMDSKEQADIIQKNELIQNYTISVIQMVRDSGIDIMSAVKAISIPDEIKNFVINQVKVNLAIDAFLDNKNKMLLSQLALYNIV